MGTPISDQGGERHPILKLRNVGDHVDAAVVDQAVIPRKVFGRDEYKTRPDGTVQTQDVVTVIVIGGNAVVSEDDVDRPAVEGEIAAIFVAGRDRWDKDGDKSKAKGAAKSWSGAKRDVGGLATGDVLRWRFDAEVPGAGDRDRKIRTFKLRRPRPEEAALEQRCDELYNDMKGGRTALEPAGAASNDIDDEEMPF